MRLFFILLLGALTVSGIGVLFIRDQALRQLDAVSRELQLPAEPELFDEASLEGLPLAARRYLAHAIAPGTPLARSVRLVLAGEMRLNQGGPLSALQAEELLAPPAGFLWRGSLGAGTQRRTGFELYANGRARRRWWLWGWLPVVDDVGRGLTLSASARVALESIWIPSALLPRREVTWTAIDADHASARMVVDGEPHDLTFGVDAEGRVERLEVQRWDPAARQGEGEPVPFVVDAVDQERTFEGFTIPVRFRAGWRREEANLFDVYFPVVEDAQYLPPAPTPLEPADAGAADGAEAQLDAAAPQPDAAVPQAHAAGGEAGSAFGADAALAAPDAAAGLQHDAGTVVRADAGVRPALPEPPPLPPPPNMDPPDDAPARR